MRWKWSKLLKQYGVALAALAVAITARRLLMDSNVQDVDGPPLMFLLSAILVAAWYGGPGPAILTTILASIYGDYVFHRFTLGGNEHTLGWDLRLGLFVIIGLSISTVMNLIRRSNARINRIERNLRLIAQVSSDIICAYDMSGELLYVNPAFEAITGNSIDELRANPLLNYVHPEDSPRIRSMFDALLTGQSFGDVEYRILALDDEVKWCRASWGPLLDEAGHQIGFTGRESDVTEHKRLEVTLRFQADASQALAGDHDWRTKLARIARLAVPSYADWCLIESIDDQSAGQIIAAAHWSAPQEARLLSQAHTVPPRIDPSDPVHAALLRGQPQIHCDVAPAAPGQGGRDSEFRRHLGAQPLLFLPILIDGRLRGLITFGSSESRTRFGESDLLFATDLARRLITALPHPDEHALTA